jgi:HEAT repeat protein
MVPALLPLLVLVSEPLTSGQVTEKLKVLAESRSLDARSEAAMWFWAHGRTKPLLKVLPELESVAAFDESPEVRGYAILAVGQIAAANKLPCPQLILDALFDNEPTEDGPDFVPVPGSAATALEKFTPPPAAALRLLRSPDSRSRETGLLVVNCFTRAGAETRKALDRQPAVTRLVRKALTDPDLNVRRAAIYSNHELTNDPAEYLSHLLRHEEDVLTLPLLKKDATDLERRQRTVLNLGGIGVASALVNRTQEAPADVVTALKKLLKEPDARTRRLAADFVGRLARAKAEPDPLQQLAFGLDPKKLVAGSRRIATDRDLFKQLEALAEKDADKAVRLVAGGAVEHIKKLGKEQ